MAKTAFHGWWGIQTEPHLSLFSPGPSRRSDLQTLGYCMLKWFYGSLPWTNCLPNTEEITRQKQK